MRVSTVISTVLVAAAPSLQAAQTFGGNAVIVNQCDYPLHLWSVDAYHQPSDSEYQTVEAHSNWTEPLRVPNVGCNCGVSIKISKGTTQTRPIVQFEYTIAEAASQSNMFTSYDISFVDCSTAQASVAAIEGYDVFSGTDCPAWDEGIKIYGTGASCPEMDCAAGEFCYKDAYFEPEPSSLLYAQPVRQCANGDLSSDIVFVTCTSNTNTDTDSDSSDNSDSYSSAVESSYVAPSSSPVFELPSSSSEVVVVPSSTPASSSSSPVAAEFAPIVTSTNSPTPTPTSTPEITSTPNIVSAAKTVYEYSTVYLTLYVNPEGERLNSDGSKYYGRRFAA